MHFLFAYPTKLKSLYTGLGEESTGVAIILSVQSICKRPLPLLILKAVVICEL